MVTNHGEHRKVEHTHVREEKCGVKNRVHHVGLQVKQIWMKESCAFQALVHKEERGEVNAHFCSTR